MPVIGDVRTRPWAWSGPVQATVVGFLLLVAWDATGFDIALARQWGDAGGFPWRHDPWLADVLHDAVKPVPWLSALVLFALAMHPGYRALQPSLARRLQWPVTALVCAAAVGILKSASLTSCPWDLQEFGGAATHLSHWRGWWQSDLGSGRCFPAGHASNGFVFVAGWFALRHTHPKAANAVLIGSLLVGAALGFVQQVRGAHFMSHTLWTAWICWAVALLMDRLFQRPVGWSIRPKPG